MERLPSFLHGHTEASYSSDDTVVLADEAGPIAAFRLTERLRPDGRCRDGRA